MSTIVHLLGVTVQPGFLSPAERPLVSDCDVPVATRGGDTDR